MSQHPILDDDFFTPGFIALMKWVLEQPPSTDRQAFIDMWNRIEDDRINAILEASQVKPGPTTGETK